jgi:arylsulfatase
MASRRRGGVSPGKSPQAPWPERTLVHHVGRWERGKAEESKYFHCSIQNSRFTLVNNKELYDLTADPGESKNVLTEHPDVAASLRATYEHWWLEVLPMMVNETAIGPKINPLKELYWKQFGGGPDEKLLKQMNPTRVVGSQGRQAPAGK